jgi:hypothetical protein
MNVVVIKVTLGGIEIVPRREMYSEPNIVGGDVHMSVFSMKREILSEASMNV